jgi:AraC-like DNA-binding protein
MALYLLNGEKTLVEFQCESIAIPAYPALPGSKVWTFLQDHLRLLIKEIIGDLFTIRYCHFSFSRNQAIESSSHKTGLHTRALLQSDGHYTIESFGTCHQQQDTVLMFWSDSIRCTTLFEKDKQYRTLDIYAAPGLLEQLAYFFPELQHLNAEERMLLLVPGPCFITPQVRDVINQILDCPYDEKTSAFYFELKVREYLFVLVEQHLRSHEKKHPFTHYESEQIHKAREILLSDLTRPPYTIRQLARKVALNEFKLKKGFKQFFHIGVFECFQSARMERARQLLLTTTKPVKEIAALSGYLRMTNFITAFRKYFGYTPASLRRTS